MLIQRIGDFLAWLGGADRSVLAQVPSARARFVQMAAVLLTTAGLAVASMSFALHDGLNAPWYVAVPLGLLWGAAILNIDRFLVLSMGATRDRGRLLLMAVPRVAMAVVLAVVISTPLVLRVFASDIKNELVLMHLQTSHTQSTLLANSLEQREANKVAQQISQDKATLNGHLPSSVTSPALQDAQSQVATLQTQEQQAQQTANAAYAAWECELYGVRCHGASGVPGNGNLAQAKQRIYEQDMQALHTVKRQLRAAVAAENSAQKQVAQSQTTDLALAQQRARAGLPGLRKQYAAILATIHQESTTATNNNFNDNGILAQLQALSDLEAKNPVLLMADLAVGALFFLVELLPVAVKILVNLGPMSAYDIVASSREEEIIDAARARRAEARRIEEGKSRTRINVADHMRGEEERLGKVANQHVASEMTTILDVALKEWSTQVRSRLGGNGNGPRAATTANGNAPAGHGTTATPGQQRSTTSVTLPSVDDL